jgi:eukaryotic-like serine/threonine-protein kinase
MRIFRLFVSSPGDADVERRRTENVVSRLNGEFAGLARIEAVRWETEYYQAHTTFQTQISEASECDIVVGILRWRLGAELPPAFPGRLPGDEPYPSGTTPTMCASPSAIPVPDCR